MPKGIYKREDKRTKGKYAPGTKHETPQGTLEVLELQDKPYVLVRFIETGYITRARTSNIVQGKVKDHRKPSVYGVGYLDGVRIMPRGTEQRALYDLWANMLKRCYAGYDPSYADCTVDKRWHSFLQFSNSIQDVPGFDAFIRGEDVHLDKDIKIPGNRTYSVFACQFVPATVNVAESQKRRWAKG